MSQLILLRHGESVWNRDNLFTGWTDVDLSGTGIAEAKQAAALLKAHDISFGRCFTSVLKRAIHTSWIVLDELDLAWLPVSHSWRLNERHYGALQGRNKDETRREFGVEQVERWRRSYRARPPALTEKDRRYPGHDRKYATVPRAELPFTESLEDTLTRLLPYWYEHIEPQLMEDHTILVTAHGTSLRGLIKHIDGVSDENIQRIEVPTGRPLVYELDRGLRPVRSFYLGADKNDSTLPNARRAADPA